MTFLMISGWLLIAVGLLGLFLAGYDWKEKHGFLLVMSGLMLIAPGIFLISFTQHALGKFGFPTDDWLTALTEGEVYLVEKSMEMTPGQQWLVWVRDRDGEVNYYLLNQKPPTSFQRKKDEKGNPIYAPWPPAGAAEAQLKVELAPQR